MPSGSEAARLVLRERDFAIMGTDVVIAVLVQDAAAGDRAIEAAAAELRRVEDMMTSWRPSPLTRLNAAAGRGPVEVPSELAGIVQRSLDISRTTEGAFDCTFAAAGRLWDFKRVPAAVPDAAAIRAALDHVDWRQVRVDVDASTIELPAGMSVGLGGIAKGYGVDRAMDVLMDLGVEHGIVNAGGDAKVLGQRFGVPWEVAIKHPRDRELAMAVLQVSNTCVVTSGDYERFFEIDGRRYHHILDPRTGHPSTGCLSATVVAPSAELADALATSLCVMGPQAGLRLVERLPRVEAVVVGMDGEVEASSGLQGAVK